jgi:hypothetical protein
MKTSIPPVLIIFALVCFGHSPIAKALLPAPSPDGGYPGGNTAEGINALHNVNTAIGINNTAVGANALTFNTTGYSNVAVGSWALANNTTGNFNMAIGPQALTNNNANFNVAIGFRVGFMNTTGNHLTGIGGGALFSNTTGSFNTAIGSDVLSRNTTGSTNTAVGVQAMHDNDIGSRNTVIGYQALFGNGAGLDNTALGAQSLYRNITGNSNTAVGEGALGSNITGNNNVAVGYGAGNLITNGEFNIDIGNIGIFDESNTIRIGDSAFQAATFIAGISGVNEGGTISAVYINTDGQLGTQPPASSRRYKKDIKPMDKVSEAILALKPVTFQYKSDNKGVPQFGLIAEEVADVNPDLVIYDADGKPYTVRYDQVNAMLLNEFLKEHRKVEEQSRKVEKQETTIGQLRSTVAQQQKDFQATVAQLTNRLDEQAAQIQKVSAQFAAANPSDGGLEVNGHAPQMISSNQ